MECIIPGTNMKVMAKAIQALSKIGDELYFQAKPEHLSLVTINMNRTAYVTFSFLDAFFSTYTLDSTESESELCDGCTCKVSMKAIAGIFKAHKEKKVELCKIHFDNVDTKMIIRVKYKHGVMMTHNVRLSDSETLTISMPNSTSGSQICAPGTFYNQLLNMFQHCDDDINWEVTKSKAVARNYDVGVQNSMKSIRTQVALNATEFNIFKIEQETIITFSLKPFRAAISFAESLNLNVTIHFQNPGRPATLLIKNPTFDVNFIIATMNPEGETQSTMSSVRTTTKAREKSAETKENEEVTAQEREAIDSVNWDDDFEMNNVKATTNGKPNFLDIMNKIKNKTNSNNNTPLRLSDNPDMEVDDDVVPRSPESPRTKKARIVFGRCIEPTFHQTMLDLGHELAANSDTDSDLDT